MPRLLDRVRGTVQGVLAASRHVLWYVRWQTRGGDDARSVINRT
jgi:hypothetical protein